MTDRDDTTGKENKPHTRSGDTMIADETMAKVRRQNLRLHERIRRIEAKALGKLNR